MNTVTTRIAHPRVLPFRGITAYAVEALCIALAVLFPMAAHALGLPIFALLPMHWTILLAGLVYGWKAGLLAGLSAPLLSTALTGMPFPALLPLITAELGIYGLLSGTLAQKRGVNAFLSLFITLLAGRGAFTLIALLSGRIDEGLAPFLQSSFAAGLPAAGLQILLLPIAAAGISRVLGAERKG